MRRLTSLSMIFLSFLMIHTAFVTFFGRKNNKVEGIISAALHEPGGEGSVPHTILGYLAAQLTQSSQRLL